MRISIIVDDEAKLLNGSQSLVNKNFTALLKKMYFTYVSIKGETGLGNRILYDYIREGRPSLVLGPGRSNVALSVADTAKYWKMIQV